MEIIEDKTYLCNGHTVKAVEMNNGEIFSKEFKSYLILNIPDLCKAMGWNDDIKNFLLSKLKNGYDQMEFSQIEDYLKTYNYEEYINYHKWVLNEIMYIEPIPPNELKEIRKQENKDMAKEILKGVAAAIGLISALLILNTL